MGTEFKAPTADETVTGVVVGNEVCCTPEYDFDCLCCLDFSVPLQKCAPGVTHPPGQGGFCMNRCGVMDLDSANAPPGSPLSMEDDAQLPIPHHQNYTAAAQAPGQIVVVCTKEVGLSEMAAAESGGGAATLPLQCIPREFTPGEIQGTVPDLKKGVPLAPGQAILDERIDLLIQQGLQASEIKTCTDHYGSKPGGPMCPADTPKAHQAPNSAGQDALSRVGAYVEADEALPEADKTAFVAEETAPKKEKMRRSYGRTFLDLADMSKSEIDTVLGDAKQIAFVAAGRVVRFQVDDVSVNTGSSLVLGGSRGEKKVAVTGGKVVFTEGEKTTEVDSSTSVITIAMTRTQMGRRAGGAMPSSGGFTLSAGSNTAGND